MENYGNITGKSRSNPKLMLILRRNVRNIFGNNFSEMGKRLRKNLKILLVIFQFFQNPLAILIRIILNILEPHFYLSKMNSKSNWNPSKCKKNFLNFQQILKNFLNSISTYIFIKNFRFSQNFSVIFKIY